MIRKLILPDIASLNISYFLRIGRRLVLQDSLIIEFFRETHNFPSNLLIKLIFFILNFFVNLLFEAEVLFVQFGKGSVPKVYDICANVRLIILVEIRVHQVGAEMAIFTSPSLLVVRQSFMVFFICYQVFVHEGFTLKKFLIIQIECAF